MADYKKRRRGSDGLGARDIGRILVAWFRENQRSLPWRRDYSPYAVWISEVMLQQTRVIKVIPYFERWMERFPDPAALADGKEDEVLRLWEGLGYYSRARNLHKAAGKIMKDHEGRIPQDEEALRRLPGVGPYTAAALRSLAFQEDVPVVDGNAERVVARLADLDQPVKIRQASQVIEEYLSRWMPKGQAREFNQAVMELGAGICTPRGPDCDVCPVRKYCRALRKGTVPERPVQVPRTPTKAVTAAAGILFDKGRVFIQKRPPKALMACLWEFPGGRVQGEEPPEECLRREMAEELGVQVNILGRVAEIRHAYTRFRVRLHAFRCKLAPSGQKISLRTAVEGRWVSLDELEDFAFPSANRRLINILGKGSPGCP